MTDYIYSCDYRLIKLESVQAGWIGMLCSALQKTLEMPLVTCYAFVNKMKSLFLNMFLKTLNSALTCQIIHVHYMDKVNLLLNHINKKKMNLYHALQVCLVLLTIRFCFLGKQMVNSLCLLALKISPSCNRNVFVNNLNS